MGGRVYDPRLGRFLSPDPVIGNPGGSQSWNLYSYAGNSPMSFTDPTGLVRSSLPWENNACGPARGCLNLDGGGGGFGSTTQRILGRGLGAVWGFRSILVPVIGRYPSGDGWQWGIGFHLIHYPVLSFVPTGQTSTEAAMPGDPEPAGMPVSSAGDVAQQSGGAEGSGGVAVAFVGGAGDRRSKVVFGIYDRYIKKRGGVGAYFEHSQGEELGDWIDHQNEQGVRAIVIGHSWGGVTAARTVAEGHRVHELRTVDPVGRRPVIKPAQFFERVAANSETWNNYDSTAGGTWGDVVAYVGRSWNDRPRGYATSHIEVAKDHVDICSEYCEP